MVPLWFWPYAVACGNTFVLKPSEQTPLTSIVLGQTQAFLAGAVVMVILLFFLLASGDLFLRKLVRVLPRLSDKKAAIEIARATGNWPITGYFTARGLPSDVAARWPWNRRSAPTSCSPRGWRSVKGNC